MEYRQFGNSGLQVPPLSLGTCTFGGKDFFKAWGNVDVRVASRMVDKCLEKDINFFDTADLYSDGLAEEILGQALKGRRYKVLISTKATFPQGDGPNDVGSSRYHIIKACEASLKRLDTDYIDIYFMHGFDALTPLEETLEALTNLISSGKVRYIGCSNYSGWHLMKALSVSDKYGLAKYVVYQGYYSLISREYEWELMPLNIDQKIGLMVWSPLGWGRLTGKIQRNQPIGDGRIAQGGAVGGPPINKEHLYNIVGVLEEIASETGKTIPQVSLNWLLQRPSVCNVVIGARNEQQLDDNLGAIGWNLTKEQVDRLDAISSLTPIYPYWHQMGFDNRNPKPVNWGKKLINK